ncbi:hypothetical protein GCM10010885_10210 [Alicyclobacillus cellulosilyticus]|uniref:Uncharacterized protein n=1 Tax=Alicyclobacillus cellulosilyticus TaxID=1003997 RepID=A0A917K6T1_9BACL|nr:hypothetical protein GCM10010885_10210 [Alicyclobacillus cellulosilyticus]
MGKKEWDLVRDRLALPQVGLASALIYLVFPAELSYLFLGLLSGNLIHFAAFAKRRLRAGRRPSPAWGYQNLDAE